MIFNPRREKLLIGVAKRNSIVLQQLTDLVISNNNRWKMKDNQSHLKDLGYPVCTNTHTQM